MPDDAVQHILDLEELKKLKYRYFRLLDAQDWDRFGELFTADLEFFFAAPGQFAPPDATRTPEGWAQVGRQQLLDWVKAGAQDVQTVHHAHMGDITITGPATARAVWAMTDYTQVVGDPPSAWFRGYGQHEEEYVRTDRGWQIRRSVFTRYEMDAIEGEIPAISS
jgi:hypothetical protein